MYIVQYILVLVLYVYCMYTYSVCFVVCRGDPEPSVGGPFLVKCALFDSLASLRSTVLFIDVPVYCSVN